MPSHVATRGSWLSHLICLSYLSCLNSSHPLLQDVSANLLVLFVVTKLKASSLKDVSANLFVLRLRLGEHYDNNDDYDYDYDYVYDDDYDNDYDCDCDNNNDYEELINCRGDSHVRPWC